MGLRNLSLSLKRVAYDPSSDRKKVAVAEAYTTFYHGQTTVGTSAVQLTTESIECKKGVLIKADDDNTGNIYVGNSDSVTSSTGFKLKAGQGVTVEINDPSKIYLIADADNQKVYWIAV